MKKRIRILSVLLLTIVLGTCLSGCRYFEELRENQAVLTAEGDIILWGDRYRVLPECDTLEPDFEYGERVAYVVDEDTPIVLSEFLGTTLDVSKDKKFLLGSMVDEFSYSVYSYRMYCREDVYDTIMNVIETGYQPDAYRASFYDWETEEYKQYVFTDEMTAAVDKILNGDEIDLNIKSLMYQTSEPVESCMTGLPFSQYEFSFIIAEEGYYLEKHIDATGENKYYEVSVEFHPVFKKLVDMWGWA